MIDNISAKTGSSLKTLYTSYYLNVFFVIFVWHEKQCVKNINAKMLATWHAFIEVCMY